MNQKALSELSGKCHECIEAWKVENWRKPLDIEFGGIIEHCRMYGGDEIQVLYDEVWDGAPEDDNEVISELWKLEKQLFFANMYDDTAEESMDEKQIERLYIGKRIAMLRAEQGMTQQELADKAGMNIEHIACIEEGGEDIDKNIMMILKSVFKVDCI